MIDDSFMRVLGISLGESVPDVTTIRKFREMLATAGRVKGVFKKFDIYLRAHGFQAMRGQKDTDARWTRKHGKNYFGYKNHIITDLG